MIDNIFNRFVIAVFTAPVIILSAFGYFSPVSDAEGRRRCLLYGLIALGILLACATARADVPPQAHRRALRGGSIARPMDVPTSGDESALSLPVPVIWDNESGCVVEVDFLDSEALESECFVPPGVWPSTWIWITSDPAGYFQAAVPFGSGVGYAIPFQMDTSGTNMNVVTFFHDPIQTWPDDGPGLDSTNGLNGSINAATVNYPWLRPGSTAEQAFYWSWFLAGWGLAIGGIMSALVWRQVRNIGADAPTM